ncbi:MAG: phosphatase PAP2 family protein [Candidatus Aenigmarchaeota archaeon]|nr:phosphatase PAP2 family protein [Candidatus Aenigmarchaeota archaeon]MDW8149688.1 phosphatase PAP2 family protein [Candidatus Aenigmarchaeota archaeon]
MDNSIIILEALARIRISFLVSFFTWIYYLEYLFIAALLLLIYLQKKNEKVILTKLFFLVFGFVLVYSIKYITKVPRPYIAALEKSDFSFPSNHLFISGFSLALLPSYSLLRYFSFFYFFFLVPISILYLGLHYLSDMLAGLLLGLFFSFLSDFVEKIFYRRAYRKKQ